MEAKIISVPKEICLVTNLIGFGLIPQAAEEVEQRITIKETGDVLLEVFSFGDGDAQNYPLSRSKEYKLDVDATAYLLSVINGFFTFEYMPLFVADVGIWNLSITDHDGNMSLHTGSLCTDLFADGIDLSELLRQTLDIEELFAFDGRFMFDDLKKITIHAGMNIFKESIIIDGEKGIVEVNQFVDKDVSTYHLYKDKERINQLFTFLKDKGIFTVIMDEPEDLAEEQDVFGRYMITVDYKKMPSYEIHGVIDKYGLPIDFPAFADTLFDFIAFYGIGEVLNSFVYNRQRRRISDVIFYSVVFEEEGKSYYYTSDDDNIFIGDKVVVPAGHDNYETVVTVIDKAYFQKDEVPISLDKVKSIIKKIENDEQSKNEQVE